MESCFPVFLDDLVSFLYCLTVCDASWFLHRIWAISQQDFVRATFSGGIGPSIVHKGRNGEPRFPIILSCQSIEVDVLFNPLVLSFCESISLWVKGCADILSYA